MILLIFFFSIFCIFLVCKWNKHVLILILCFKLNYDLSGDNMLRGWRVDLKNAVLVCNSGKTVVNTFICIVYIIITTMW